MFRGRDTQGPLERQETTLIRKRNRQRASAGARSPQQRLYHAILALADPSLGPHHDVPLTGTARVGLQISLELLRVKA